MTWPKFKHDDPLGDRHDELHVVLDQQHGDPELAVDPRMSSASSTFSAGLVPAAGSSSSSTSGFVPRARAISRRRRSP